MKPVATVTRRSAFFIRYSVAFTDPKRGPLTVFATVYEDGSPMFLQIPYRNGFAKVRESRCRTLLPIVEEAIKNEMATPIL